MSGTIQASVVKDSASATNNLTLDASGNVTVGANQTVTGNQIVSGTLAVTGTTTLTGGVTQTGSSTAASFIPSGSTVPTNGVFLPSANTLALATNSTNQVSISSTGIVTGTAGNLMLVQGTAVASTSGTSITFSSIPSWVKRITVMFNGVSTSGVSPYIMQIGSGSVTSTGYISAGLNYGPSSVALANFTTGMAIINVVAAAYTYSGIATISNISGNTWTYSAQLGSGSTAFGSGAGSSPALGGALDRVVITTVNGTDTFDAGSINIQWE